ncbi:DUF3995 domain-containing protein [Amycolatopsis acidicola]|uniref:DUF3995 domain-containing protein n=1 Tax=Amycolatopsis acidicola TaxID=2596893 RepID=A0A5N0V390_9PSEU|nr:DUF3995 domain-containing protein [Amycolatopsis acidicola]KAA9159762.1 DUF3995 domain-containing protein [Amycolatopsis acidicola]
MGALRGIDRRSPVTRDRIGVVAAYAAGVLGSAYALLSIYWTAGGQLLLDTVGGQIEDLARRGGAAAFAIGAGATVLKLIGAAMGFWLAVTHGRPRWLLVLATLAGSLLIVYGGVLVVTGALVLTGVTDPPGEVDYNALTWHVALWDLWFLVWGVAYAVAAVAFRWKWR